MEADNLKDYYVLLTGGKNNAGDFLIKDRAKKLLNKIRPDRDFVDLNAWEPFDKEKLKLVNRSKALLLTGGPALQRKMYGGVYKLTENLDDIEVPIISLGIGWHSDKGDWEDVHNYWINSKSRELINRMAKSGYYSSVRDYHSMHVLQKEGMQNVKMTGCPALYDLENIGTEIEVSSINKILFSLGVSFVKSKKMEEQVKKLLLHLNNRFQESTLKVMFHHSIDKSYLETPGSDKELFRKNIEFSRWLEKESIAYQDVSGSASGLKKEYADADFHIGYRVHAHIFMSSISKPSILVAEDGRGKALRELLGGCIFDGFTDRKNSLFSKGLAKFGLLPMDIFTVDKELTNLIIETVNYEIKNNFPRLKATRSNIDRHFDIMRNFIMQLP